MLASDERRADADVIESSPRISPLGEVMTVEPVRFISHMEAKAATSEELREMLEALVHELKMEDGCFDAALLQDIRRPDSFTMIEQWISVEAHDSFEDALREAGVTDAIVDMLKGRPDTRAYLRLV
jgi:quinol monooxygenase YgiN